MRIKENFIDGIITIAKAMIMIVLCAIIISPLIGVMLLLPYSLWFALLLIPVAYLTGVLLNYITNKLERMKI